VNVCPTGLGMATEPQRSRAVFIPFDERRAVVYHSLLGQPQLVEFHDSEQEEHFSLAIQAGPVTSGLTELDGILETDDRAAREIVSLTRRDYLSFPSRQINFLSLLTSEACNLGCPYCIAAQNMRVAVANRSVTMPWDTAKLAVDWYFSIASDHREHYINFSGGEPLLNWSVVSRTLEYVKSSHPEQSVRFTLNTNATLITAAIARTLKEYDVDVGTSLDGPPASSDLVRIGKATRLGVSEKILVGWRNLAEAGRPVTGFMATFNDRNIHCLNEEVVEFAHRMGMKWLRVDCDVIHLLQFPVDEVTERLWSVYRRGKELGIHVEGFWSTAIHNLVSPADRKSPRFFCGAASGETISIHPDGRISTCGFSRRHLGNIRVPSSFNAELYLELVKSCAPGERDFCKGCSIEGSCAGGCNIAREEAEATRSNKAIEYNCQMYREMTRRLLIDYFQDQMSEEKRRRADPYNCSFCSP
jgi:uncharacterized protein